MAVFTNLSNAEISDILSAYNIGQLTEFKGISEGVENSNFIIQTTKNKYILTIYENRTDIKSLPFFLGLMNFLNENNFKCPEVITNKNSELIGEVKGKKFAIISFLEGKTISEVTDINLVLSAQKLAEFHNITASFKSSRENSLSRNFWRETYTEVRTEAEQEFPELKSLMETAFQKITESWPQENEFLLKTIIHGDYFPDNVMVNDSKVSGIIDFYMACEDFAIYDLAIAINAWCFDKNFIVDKHKVNLFLQNYNNIRELTEAELNFLPVFSVGASLRFLVTRLYDYFNTEQGADVKIKNPQEYIEKLKLHLNIKEYKDYGYEF